jgi:hypothetical protein
VLQEASVHNLVLLTLTEADEHERLGVTALPHYQVHEVPFYEFVTGRLARARLDHGLLQ